MLVQYITIFAAVAVFGALLLPLSGKLGLSHGALLLAAGFVGSELFVAAGYDTGLRWYHVNDLVVFVLLPALVFESAMTLDFAAIRRVLPLVLVLALPGTIAVTALTGMLLYLLVDHPVGFPLAVALLAGSIIAAVDAERVASGCHRNARQTEASVLIEGESLFGDAVAIVLFSVLLGLTLEPADGPAFWQPGLQFIAVFAGGLALGAVGGWLFRRLDLALVNLEARTLLSIAAVYLTYIVAESVLGVSGVLAVLACAVSFRQFGRSGRFDDVVSSWRAIGLGARVAVFVIAGATITPAMLREQWLAMLIGIAAAMLARACVVSATVACWNGLRPAGRVTYLTLACGSGPGTVALALALSLPLDLDAWYTVQAIVYGAVIFSVFSRGPLLTLAGKRGIAPTDSP